MSETTSAGDNPMEAEAPERASEEVELEISFEANAQDQRAVRWVMEKLKITRSAGWWRWAWLAGSVIGVGIIQLVAVVPYVNDDGAATTASVVGALLVSSGLALLGWMLYLVFRRERARRGHRQILTIRFCRDALCYDAGGAAVRVDWRSLQRWKEARGCFVVVLPGNRSLLPIPHRALASDRDVARVREMLRLRIQSSSAGFPVQVP